MLSLFNHVSFVASPRILPTPHAHPSRGIQRAPSGRGLSLGKSLFLWAFVATLVGAPETLGRPQRFEGRTTKIAVKTPPMVYLPGPTLRVEVTSLRPVTQRVPALIQQTIQDTLVRNGPGFRLTTGVPDTLIACTITDFGHSTGVEARTWQEYQKIGVVTVTDPPNANEEEGSPPRTHTEDQFGYVDVPYRALVINARMNVNCEVKDVATGIVLYAEVFDPLYSDASDVAAGPRSDDLNAIYLSLAGQAARLILAQFSPGIYPVDVWLPSGKLKEASKLMEASLWKEALDLLAATPPFKDQRDEAARRHSIGIAHEALAYAAPNSAERRRLLEQSLDSYRRATELNPMEDWFWPPKDRVESMLWQDNGVAAQVEAFNEAKKPGSTASAQGKADLFLQVQSRMQPAIVALTNDDVVRWVKAGRSSDYIAANIRHARETKFDLSDLEKSRLRQEGVSDMVLTAMRQSQLGIRDSGRSAKHGKKAALVLGLLQLWWVPLALAR